MRSIEIDRTIDAMLRDTAEKVADALEQGDRVAPPADVNDVYEILKGVYKIGYGQGVVQGAKEATGRVVSAIQAMIDTEETPK